MYKENLFGSVVAIAGTAVTLFLGGWDVPMKMLVYLMVVDYATGVLGAFRTKTINSEIMFWGGIRKGVIFLVVAMAVLLDQLIGNDAPIFRMLALYFYIGREGLSIVENLGILGVPLPSWIRKVLEQLKEKGEQR